MAEEAKRIRYPALPAAGLLAAEPFCVETFGRLGSWEGLLSVEVRMGVGTEKSGMRERTPKLTQRHRQTNSNSCTQPEAERRALEATM